MAEKKIYEKAYPIDDLIIESIIRIGEVQIIPGKEGLEPWENDLRRLLNRKDIGDTARQALAEYFQKLINGIMGDQDKSYAVVKIEAERTSDTYEALQKADRALDIIRLMQFRYGKHPSGYTGFSIHSSVRSHLLESIMRSDEGLSGGSERKGPLIPQVLERAKINEMVESQEYKALCRLIGKDSPEEMERKILTAITWFGSAMHEYQEHIKLTKFVISVEALLSVPSDKGRIRKNTGERLAFLLTESEQDKRKDEHLEKRSQYEEEWKEIYQRRSDIVHKGDVEVDDEMQERAIALAKNAILSIILKDDIRSIKQLREWHERLKPR